MIYIGHLRSESKNGIPKASNYKVLIADAFLIESRKRGRINHNWPKGHNISNERAALKLRKKLFNLMSTIISNGSFPMCREAWANSQQEVDQQQLQQQSQQQAQICTRMVL